MTRLLLLPLCLVSFWLTGCNTAPEKAASKEQETAVLNPALGVDAESFVDGNLFFLGYHELGHALISEFDLPVVGREEDAVDRLAIWMMTPAEGDGEPDYLMGAMHGWFLTAAQTPLINIEWWDEHGTDQQRGYQIACLLYGSGPDRFGKAADAARLPEEKLEGCEYEASQNDKSWIKLLEPNQRAEGDVAAADTVSIVYEPTTDFADDAAYLKGTGLLEDIGELMRTNYTLKPGIKIVGKECEEANAFWSADDRTLTICYELVGDYRVIAANKPNAAKGDAS